METKVAGIICDVEDCIEEVMQENVTYDDPDHMILSLHSMWSAHTRRKHPHITSGVYRVLVILKD